MKPSLRFYVVVFRNCFKSSLILKLYVMAKTASAFTTGWNWMTLQRSYHSVPEFCYNFQDYRLHWFRTDTPFHKFILNMRLLLQFPSALLTFSIVNLPLNRTKDEKRAFPWQQIKICKGFIIPFISWNWDSYCMLLFYLYLWKGVLFGDCQFLNLPGSTSWWWVGLPAIITWRVAKIFYWLTQRSSID